MFPEVGAPRCGATCPHGTRFCCRSVGPARRTRGCSPEDNGVSRHALARQRDPVNVDGGKVNAKTKQGMKRLKDIVCAGGLLFCPALGHADGLDRWQVRDSAAQGIYFSSIDSGPDRFVAVSESGRIVTSTDAVQWTLANSGTMNRLENLASGNGIFVATGVPDTVIRSSDGTNWQSAGWQELDTVVRGVALRMANSFCWLPRFRVRQGCLSRAVARTGRATVSRTCLVISPLSCTAWRMETATTWLSERGVALTSFLTQVHSCGFRRTLSLGKTFSCLTGFSGHTPFYGGTESSSLV